MLNRFRYYKHDFRMHISKVMSIKTQYNVASFVMYLENIIIWVCSHDKYSPKKCHTLGVVNRSSCKTCSMVILPMNKHEVEHPIVIGGGDLKLFSFKDLKPFLSGKQTDGLEAQTFKYVDHMKLFDATNKYNSEHVLLCQIPIHAFVFKLSILQLQAIAKQHDIKILAHANKSSIFEAFEKHNVSSCCSEYVCVLEPHCKVSHNQKCKNYCIRKTNFFQSDVKDTPKVASHSQHINQINSSNTTFPPLPPTTELRQKIIHDFCEATAPLQFQEAGCAICGALVLCSDLIRLDNLNLKLDHLTADGMGYTRMERKVSSDPICELNGPIIDQDCRYICKPCKETVKRGRVPKLALARGLWLGKVPDELQGLSFTEQLLVGRIRHNRCIVRVAKGMHKMIANAVTFEHPMQKIYTVLPPPIEEMDELLAFIFTGPCQPTKDDFHRTPLLVHRNKVSRALEWLKCNHIDYADLEISYKNLASYPEDMPPVVINYRHSVTNKIPEATSVHDMELKNGTTEGICPFTVHTLTSEEYDTMNSETLKAIAAKHLDDGGKVLAIGHSKEPQSIWKNPKLYPQMFPWLFPYGLGGIGHERQKHRLSDEEHKRHLLMYHDKCFQKDPHFPLIAFNHEQIKDSTKGGFILAKQKSFDNIANRLLQINSDVLKNITERMMNGERVKGDSQEEKDCLQLIHDIDRIGGHVKGSITSKKYMRNEIWSLISFRGAPSWYITLSPADNKHPISLYYADTKEEFTPIIRSKSEKDCLIADNPVASA